MLILLVVLWQQSLREGEPKLNQNAGKQANSKNSGGGQPNLVQIFLLLDNVLGQLALFIMSQVQSTPVPSFLLKLREIMISDQYSHIIRWDKSGQILCIVCVQALEEGVLPHYFRHARYASFVRQLNMYGFNKTKAEKNVSAAFVSKHFSKDNINFSAMSKKGKKQALHDMTKSSINNEMRIGEEMQAQHQNSTQLSQNCYKLSAYNKQINTQFRDTGLNPENLPEINQLIEELEQKIEPLISEINWLNCRELQLLIKEPKYSKITYAMLGIFNLEQITQFTELPLCPISSDRMEFIL